MARVDTPISYINLAAPLEIRPTRGKSRLNRVERDGERNSTALLLSSSFPVNSIRPNIFPLLPPPKWTRLSLSGVKGDHVSVERVFLLFFSSSLESVLIPSPLFSLRMFLLDLTLRRRDRIFELEWNFDRFEEGLRWILSIFREFAGKWRGWVCSWRAINQSDSDNWWNNGAIDNDTREKIVFVGWNWVPTSFRDSI